MSCNKKTPSKIILPKLHNELASSCTAWGITNISVWHKGRAAMLICMKQHHIRYIPVLISTGAIFNFDTDFVLVLAVVKHFSLNMNKTHSFRRQMHHRILGMYQAKYGKFGGEAFGERIRESLITHTGCFDAV